MVSAGLDLIRSSLSRHLQVTARPGGAGREALDTYFDDFSASRLSLPAFIARRPLHAIRVGYRLFRLPMLAASFSTAGDGQYLREALARRIGLMPAGQLGVALLRIPETPADYLRGRSRQAVRTSVRYAERLGLLCRSVTEADERQELLRVANDAERNHVNEEYRRSDPDNADLLRFGVWAAVFSLTGEPLALAVIPTDGAWGSLRYFRTLGHGRTFSASRFFLMYHVVERMSQLGVRYLFAPEHPMSLTPGLRYFQRLTGFEMMRVKIR